MTTTFDQAASPAFDIEPYKWLEDEVLRERINTVRTEMGPSLLILGHHYQQDEVIALADLRGDSYKLSELAAATRPKARASSTTGVMKSAVATRARSSSRR